MPPIKQTIEWRMAHSKRMKGLGNPFYGKHHSEKSRLKISKLNLGKIAWNKGLTKETNNSVLKISLSKKGKLPPCGGFQAGKKHWNWNPNREEVRRNLRNDAEYCLWVKRVKKRDNNICRLKDDNCSGYNIAHHIKGWGQYKKLRYETNNGITLCQAHHPRKRAEEKRLIPFFQGLVSVSSG